MTKLKYLPVNWVDGMKINKNHFISTEDALVDKINVTASINLNAINYGLLPIDPGTSDSIEFSLDIDDQDVIELRLIKCSAITYGGIIIDYDSFDDSSDSQSVFSIQDKIDIRDKKDGEYYVILSVNPFKRIPAGPADPEESPPRNPHIMPSYKIGIVKVNEINIKELGKYFIPIGIINIAKGDALLSDKYIPPCTSVSSHKKLINFHNKLSEFWSKIEMDITTIISKIHVKRQQSTLSSSVHTLTLKILDFINSNMVIHNWYTMHQPPINMVSMTVQLARIIRNNIEVLSHKHKEELINYFTDWCNLRTGEFEDLLYRTINLEYDQENISNTLKEVSTFLEIINDLFTTLSGLDYIGKQKQTGIFVKEEMNRRLRDDEVFKPKTDNLSRTSFLADD